MTESEKTQDEIAGKRIKSFLERIERLEEEKSNISEDIKEIYSEAKGVGFDTKAIRALVKLRKMDADRRREEETILEMYKAAVGLE